MPAKPATSRHPVLKTYRLANHPIFIIGCFNAGITVYSQQVRALNLASALVSSGVIPRTAVGEQTRVAVVGSGFAGLTLAAGLVKMAVPADITIFERRDTFLPHGLVGGGSVW